MVAVAGEFSEEFEVLPGGEGREGVSVSGEFLEFPQGAQAGEEGGYLPTTAGQTGEVLGEGGGVC